MVRSLSAPGPCGMLVSSSWQAAKQPPRTTSDTRVGVNITATLVAKFGS